MHRGTATLVAVALAAVTATYVVAYTRSFPGPPTDTNPRLNTPNDPDFLNGDLWGLNKINGPKAWDIRTDASSVIVAEIDIGVDRKLVAKKFQEQDPAWLNLTMPR